MKGAERLCAALEGLSVDTVFGLPGSQNVALFDALRTSKFAPSWPRTSSRRPSWRTGTRAPRAGPACSSRSPDPDSPTL